MKNKKNIIIAVVAIVVILIIVAIVYSLTSSNSNDVTTENQVSDTVEENVAEDLGDDEDDEVDESLELTGEEYTPSVVYDEEEQEVDLSEYADKPMLLYFFNSDEDMSLYILDLVENLYETYSENVNFVYISLDNQASEFAGLNGTIVNDSDENALNDYDIEISPTLVFVNANNEVINKIEGDEVDQDTIDANLAIISNQY